MQQKLKKHSGENGQKMYTLIGTILCIILLPVLLINLTLIIKSYINREEVPTLGGIFPMIVLTDSMYPVIESGDLIICSTIDVEQIQQGDVISFYDPQGNGTSVVTHRVMEIKEVDGKQSFVTKGDNNNTSDQIPVNADQVIGIYRKRIPRAGNIAMFMQTTPGLILCCICPILLLVGWDMIRRKRYEQDKEKVTEALMEELKALRALQEEKDKEK